MPHRVTLCRMKPHGADWALVREVVHGEIYRRGDNVLAFAERLGLSRATVDRLDRGKSARSSIYAIEGALGWPRGALDAIAAHDTGALERMGLDPDLIREIATRVEPGADLDPEISAELASVYDDPALTDRDRADLRRILRKTGRSADGRVN